MLIASQGVLDYLFDFVWAYIPAVEEFQYDILGADRCVSVYNFGIIQEFKHFVIGPHTQHFNTKISPIDRDDLFEKLIKFFVRRFFAPNERARGGL